VLGRPTALLDSVGRAGHRVFALGAARAQEAGRLRRAVVNLRAIARFVRVARSRRYHVVDAWLLPAYLVAVLTRPLTRVPVVLAGRRGSDGLAYYGVVPRLLDRLARRMADAVVTNSTDVAASLIDREGMDPARVHAIRNAVTVPEPASDAAIRAIRAAHGWPADGLLVGCVSHLRPEKRVDVLVEAVGRAPLAPGVAVVIVGDGVRRRALEARVRELGSTEVVHFAGGVPDAAALTPAFDVVVNPSDREGISNTILEAAAAGRAVVATRVGGTPEILTDGVSGLLVPPGDPGALRAALDRLLGDPALRERLGNAAREDVADRFGIDRLVGRTAALYEAVLQAAARRDRRAAAVVGPVGTRPERG
jgi:glycosyltransferase involved in cell wall biosynthesis